MQLLAGYITGVLVDTFPNGCTTPERKTKVYAAARKNFLFHDTEDGAKASTIVMSLIETVRANGLNPFQYLYTLLQFMPDNKDSTTSIEELMSWSEFI